MDSKFIESISYANNRTISVFSLDNTAFHYDKTEHVFDNHHAVIRKLHSHTFFFFAWMEKGKYKYCVDMDQYDLCENTLLFLAPGTFHSTTPLEDVSGITFDWNEEVFAAMPKSWAEHFLFDLFANVPYLHITNPDSLAIIKRLMADLVEEFERVKGDASRYRMINLISRLCLLLNTICSLPEYLQLDFTRFHDKPQSRERYLQFMAKVEENYKSHHNVRFYADELCFSTSILTKCCRDNAQKSPLEIINGRILLEAKRMLINSDLKSNEISQELGFIEHSHFINFFKRYTSLTPTTFRDQYRIK